MSMELLHHGALEYWVSDRLPIPHAFTTRFGGVSAGHLASLNLGVSRGDDPKNVRENYRILGQAVGFDPLAVAGTHQVHGKAIRVVTAEDRGALWVPELGWDCDGLITNEPGIPLAVFSADCGTVLLYDPIRQAIGAVHSGWRGTALGIAKEAVLAMEQSYGSKPEDLIAVLGPCISVCCFETGPEVPQAMRDALGQQAEPCIRQTGPEKYHVDLKAINRLWLESCGVNAIDVCPACTACEPDRYWSYRRVGDARGSLAAIVTLPDREASK